MLVTMKELLHRASLENYAIAAPNVTQEFDARAYIEVAEDMNAPLILDVAYVHNPDMVFFCRYLSELCEMSRIPIAINQDHGAAFAHSIRALVGGCTSIMIDRSVLPYEENVAEVKELTKIAHAAGASVEAELGHVGQAAQYEIDRNAALTDPEQARKYIEETGIDALAVAIGTAHGAYKGVPYLDYDRLVAIKKAVGQAFPLVLHGGSGTGYEAIGKACKLGINKVNIANDLFKAATDAIVDAKLSGNGYYEVWNVAKKGMQEKLGAYIAALGSEGKAWVPEKRGLPRMKTVMAE